jgi:hypothetical protein
MKIKLKEGLNNPPEKTAKGLADKINAWYDFNTNYIDDGGQRRAAQRNNQNIEEWFSEHPTEIKKEAYTILKSMASKWGGGYASQLDRIFGKKVNENVNEDVNWGTIRNVFVKFLKTNTKELETLVNANDLEGTKSVIKSIISGLSNAQKSLKLEGVTKTSSLNEVTVTRIPNFNLESDAYIVMLYLLKNNSEFKKVATNAGIDLFSGANTKTVFGGLHNNLKKVITPQIIKSVVQTLNQKRKVLFIDDSDIQKGVHNDRFAGLLALGVIDSFINDPVDTKLLKDLGNAKLNDLANQFSIGRGKMKLGAMLGNKGF